MHELSQSARASLEHALDPAERVEMVAPAVGSDMVLTDQRLIIVREGADFRPRSGIRSFVLDRDLEVRMEPARRRVIIRSAGMTINLFIRSEQVTRTEALLAEVRRRIYSL